MKQTETQRSSSKLASDAAPKEKWIVNIRDMLEFENDDKDACHTRVCILKVQKHLKSMKPEAYIPQFIGLGPYHHWDDDLLEMERYKTMATSKRLKKHQEGKKEEEDMMMIMGGHKKAELLDFPHVVGKLIEDHCRIRACYDKNLDHLDNDELAWMMAIDAVFLLEFLLSFARKHRSVFELSPRMSYLIDPDQSAYHFILRDAMTLENQIPMFVLQKVISGFSSSSQDFPYSAAANAGAVGHHHPHHMTAAHDHCDDYSNQRLEVMLIRVCNIVSPLALEIKKDFQAAPTDREHLLDLLYSLIVPSFSRPDVVHAQQMADSPSASYKRQEVDNGEFDLELQTEGKNGTHANPEGPADEVGGCRNLKRPPFKISAAKVLSIRLEGVFVESKLVRVISDLAAKIINTFGGQSWLSRAGKLAEEIIEREDLTGTRSPLVEEITIPSVSQLHEVGINFRPAQEPGIDNIKFDKIRREFHLPRVRIDENSEAVLRNLVAYEASAVRSPYLVLARYTELMNGIIDDAKDVALLRKSGVIRNRMKSDDEVAALWNGMSKSIRLTNIEHIDRAIEEVNRSYVSSPKVRVWIKARNFVNGSWKCLMVLSAFLLVALMALQSFCEVYSCPRIFFDFENYSPTK